MREVAQRRAGGGCLPQCKSQSILNWHMYWSKSMQYRSTVNVALKEMSLLWAGDLAQEDASKFHES